MKKTTLASLTLLLVSALASACGGGSLVAAKPTSPVVNDAVTDMWSDEIKHVAQSGDWILTRSYSRMGDAISMATPGEELSHSSIYDAERGTIIEAITPVVREVPLEDLLARNRVVMVVRPRGLTPEQRRASVAKARTTLGKKYDYTGLIGLPDSARFYCTELVVWAAGLPESVVITPASLLEHGPVIYYGGKRDDKQLQDVALTRSKRATEAVAAKR